MVTTREIAGSRSTVPMGRAGLFWMSRATSSKSADVGYVGHAMLIERARREGGIVDDGILKGGELSMTLSLSREREVRSCAV